MKFLSFMLLTTLIFQLMGCANSKNKSNDKASTVDIFTLHPSKYQVDFVAYNSDSTWKISVHFDNSVIFTDKNEHVIFRTEDFNTTVASGANIVHLNTENTNEKLQLTIDISSCNQEGKKVDLVYSDTDKNIKIKESACGFYQGDIQLFNLWTLTHLNGKKFDRSKFRKQPPFFEFNLDKNEVSGFGGCNDFSGKLRFEYQSMFIDHLMATKIYCQEESAIETPLFNMLRGERIHPTFKEGILILETTKGSCQFRKVD